MPPRDRTPEPTFTTTRFGWPSQARRSTVGDGLREVMRRLSRRPEGGGNLLHEGRNRLGRQCRDGYQAEAARGGRRGEARQPVRMGAIDLVRGDDPWQTNEGGVVGGQLGLHGSQGR